MPEERRRRRRKTKIQLSKLYTFACGKSNDPVDQSRIGGPGFSRVVQTSNTPDLQLTDYPLNSISTTKYNVFTFIPKSLFEQFRRVANVYFLITTCLAYTPLAPYSGTSAALPLVVVLLATMVKEAIEDRKRKLMDNEVNSRKVKMLAHEGVFEYTEWRNLQVGDVVKVGKDEFFPADLILLSSNYGDSICYVETMNLDGETNLKLKQALGVTSNSQEEESFQDFQAVIKCEDPNANLYTFVGSIELEGQNHPLSPQQLLLRDSKLRNTDYIYGLVVFTGHDTKVMQNSMRPPSKRSTIERKMDRIIYFLLCLLVLISFIGSIFFGIWTKDDLENGKTKRWYLKPDDTTIYFDPKKAGVSAVLHFLTAMVLYGYFIPISLYISIEIVKTLQARFINSDIQMYHEESDTPAHARTSNLNEELGQVDTILSDKTGTLTCNSMEFMKCTIGGVQYGTGFTEVEKAMARRRGSALLINEENENDNDVQTEVKSKIKGFNFTDKRIMGGNWINQKNKGIIENFFRLLGICHTCIPEVDEITGQVSYEAESPDEAAFVVAARELGFEFSKRTQTSVSIKEHDPLSGKITERTYTLLNILEFSSARKRMSVIVRDENGKLLLLSKGADSVMFERLAREESDYEEITKEHINEYADAGLRTLVLAYREIDEKEYMYFNKRFTSAKNLISADRDEKIDEAADMIEKDLILLGATAVEDKLQQGVPECIDKLAQAGIKIWVLTGDKMETAINIGYACSLLRQGMKQILISLDMPEIISLEKNGNKESIAKASKDAVLRQINEGKKLINGSGNESFALIIDGKCLTYALEDDVKDIFLQLAVLCGSVICCRSSPKQKALVTRLVKTGTGKVTLGIGDGANDVGMLQEADIGVGISGAEGMQAVMASDVSIAQFRFLERLLLVHGHWCYRRIASMVCYFFYKNIAFGMTLFIFEAYTSFSGQAAYDDWAMSLYNVLFTSLAVIALGVFDQDVSARFCLKFPMLYQEGPRNDLFTWSRIIGWMINGTITSVIIFFLLRFSFAPQSILHNGQPADMATFGIAMYTCVVWAVNAQMALSISYFTLIHHVFIWGGIALWYIFLLCYGAITPSFSTTYYMAFVKELAPAPLYWVVTLCVSIASLVPYYTYRSVQMRFSPKLHDLIQWMRYEGRADDPEIGNVIRQASVRATVGVSARYDASNHQTGRVHHVVQTP